MGALAEELNSLRRGRGVMAGDLQGRVGPQLRAAMGISPGANTAEFRGRLVGLLEKLAAEMPEDLRLAFTAGLALGGDVQYRFFDERMRWLARRLDRDVRTARRRVTEAIALAESALAASVPAAAGGAFEYVPDGWHLARLRSLLRLDAARPAAVEERVVVASNDGLDEIVLSTRIPPVTGDPAACPPGNGLEVAVLYGGSLVRLERLSGYYFRYSVGLPSPLRRGQSHELGVELIIPPCQPLSPRYVFQPLRRCDEFDLRIRFGPDGAGTRVWNIAGLPRGIVDDFAAPDALVRPDRAGDVHLCYERLRIGFAYGARWSR